MAPKFEKATGLANLIFIDDSWLSDHGITLYHLAGCSDMLISDVSSIIIDYLLLDQPIICVSADFEEYKRTRGFYFKDIENWIPTRINRNQTELFRFLEQILATGADPYETKRLQLKNEFFTFQDAGSTQRLMSHIFN